MPDLPWVLFQALQGRRVMNATTVVTVAGKPTEKGRESFLRCILYHNKRHPLDVGKQEVV